MAYIYCYIGGKRQKMAELAKSANFNVGICTNLHFCIICRAQYVQALVGHMFDSEVNVCGRKNPIILNTHVVSTFDVNYAIHNELMVGCFYPFSYYEIPQKNRHKFRRKLDG
jgi:hypothetical protein